MGLRFAMVSLGQKLQDIFEIGFKKAWSDRRKIALGEKNTFGNKTLADRFRKSGKVLTVWSSIEINQESLSFFANV